MITDGSKDGNVDAPTEAPPTPLSFAGLSYNEEWLSICNCLMIHNVIETAL